MDIYHCVGTAAPSAQTSSRVVSESAAPNQCLVRSRATTPPRGAEVGSKDNIPASRAESGAAQEMIFSLSDNATQSLFP